MPRHQAKKLSLRYKTSFRRYCPPADQTARKYLLDTLAGIEEALPKPNRSCHLDAFCGCTTKFIYRAVAFQPFRTPLEQAGNDCIDFGY